MGVGVGEGFVLFPLADLFYSIVQLISLTLNYK